MTHPIFLKNWRAVVKQRRRSGTRASAIPVHHDVMSQLLDTYELVQELSRLPCEIGWVDKKRCDKHANEYPRARWCHPCLCAYELQNGRK